MARLKGTVDAVAGGITDAGVTVTLSETAAIMDELYADFSRLADIGLTRATAS
jgi:hypothetical protein